MSAHYVLNLREATITNKNGGELNHYILALKTILRINNSKSLKLLGQWIQSISTSSYLTIKNLLFQELSKFFFKKHLLETQSTSISDNKPLLLRIKYVKKFRSMQN